MIITTSDDKLMLLYTFSRRCQEGSLEHSPLLEAPAVCRWGLMHMDPFPFPGWLKAGRAALGKNRIQAWRRLRGFGGFRRNLSPFRIEGIIIGKITENSAIPHITRQRGDAQRPP